MVNRRTVMTGAALGGVLSALAAPSTLEAAGSPQATDRATEDVARAVMAVRDEVARQYTFWEIAPVRDQIRTFLRANSKFPDYIDVGTDVWYQVYDWHVRFQQPVMLGRTADGRNTIALLATTVVLRPEMAPAYIGTPYDNR
jgi:hypothetical protein